MMQYLLKIISNTLMIVFVFVVLPSELFADTFTWDFDTPSQYDYDSGKIEVNGSKARLRILGNPIWWQSQWEQRRQLTIDPAAEGYSLCLDIDGADATAIFNDSLASGNDVRLLWFNGSSWVELDRWLQVFSTTEIRIWFKVQESGGWAGGASNYYVYYDNAAAGVAPSDLETIFKFADEFTGLTIDASKWNEADPGSTVSQNDKLIFTLGTNAWNTAVYTVPTFDRADSLVVEWDYVYTGGRSSPHDAFMFGWRDNSASASFAALVYGYYNNQPVIGSVWAYEDGSSRGAKPGVWVKDQAYVIRMVLKPGGGCLYQRSTDGGNTFETSFDSNYSTESPLTIGLCNHSQSCEIDNLRVRSYTGPEPTLSIGASEVNLYATNSPDIRPGIAFGVGFDEVTAFSIIVGGTDPGTVTFQVSNNGSDWYFWDGSGWVVATIPTESNDVTTIDSNIALLEDHQGKGTFYFRAFLNSNGIQDMEIDQVSITHTPPVNPPQLTLLSPDNGSSGREITISGANFGAIQGSSKVLYQGLDMGVATSWSDASITFNAPDDALSGGVLVVVDSILSNALTFTINGPQITLLDPNAAYFGAFITIQGQGFGATKGSSTLVFFDNKTPTIVSWSDSLIEAFVPVGTQTGTVVVSTAGGGASNGVLFTRIPDNSRWAFDDINDYVISDAAAVDVAGDFAFLKGFNIPTWWDTSYANRRQLTISAASQNYAVELRMSGADATSIFSQSLVSDNDLRICYWNGTVWSELDRHVSHLSNSFVSVYFKIQEAGGWAGGLSDYYLYYGNSDAGPPPNDFDSIFSFGDTFTGSTIDVAKWSEADPGSTVTQNDKLIFTLGTNNWNTAVYSVPNFNRADGLVLEWDYKYTGGRTSPHDAFMFGWRDTSASASFSALVYGYYNNQPVLGAVSAYEDGANRGLLPGSWVKDQDYIIRMVLKPGGGCLYQRSSDGGNTFETSYDSSYSVETPLTIGFANYSQSCEIDNLRVRPHQTVEPTVIASAEQNISYATTRPYIQPAVGNGEDFGIITTINVIEGVSSQGTITFQVSNNGSDWFYYNGSNWSATALLTDVTSIQDLQDNIGTFHSDVGSGTFFFRAFFESDGTQNVVIDSIVITVLPNVPPDDPTALGPAGYVDGSGSIDNSPTLQFNQSDNDAGDTLRFRFQIDDNSDFLSPVVDYTSAFIAQGMTSFTIGQAAGGGSYTIGNPGQTLTATSYFWRVLSDDGVATSAYATANGGSVAFTINTLPTVATPISDVMVLEGAANSVINLLSAFTDAEDDDDDLWYTFTGNTNPGLFNGFSIDQAANTLTFLHAMDEFGMATITVRATDSLGGTVTDSFDIIVTGVNDEPSFTKGPGQVTVEDSGMKTLGNWVTNISVGPANESAQNPSFIVVADDTSLFSIQPSVSSTGTLTYTPSDDAFGATMVTISVMDDGGIDNAGDNMSPSQVFEISINPVNDPPSFTAGPQQTLDEDAGMQAVSNWATTLDKGPENEDNQTLSFDLVNNNNALFSSQPAIDGSGTLTYTPATNAHGSTTVTVTLMDDGGTGIGGDNSADPIEFMITVTNLNDAPSFTKGPNQNHDEDAGPQTIANWATNISPGPADEAGQGLTFNVSNDNNLLFSTQPSIASNGTLTYTSMSDATGVATVTVTLMDDGGTPNGGDDESDPQVFSISVAMEDDPPTLLRNNPLLIMKDETNNNIYDDLLAFTDIDHDDNDITFKIQSLPDNGILRINGNPASLGDNDSFTQADLNANTVVLYDHDGSESLIESFTFDVEDDGDAQAVGNPYTFTIQVTLVQADVGDDIVNGPGHFQLDGTDSLLSSGTTIQWLYDDGPAGTSVTINDDDTLTPNFNAFAVGTYYFTLSLNNPSFGNSSDSVTVTVDEANPIAVIDPLEPNFDLLDGQMQVQSLTLSGEDSFDPNEPGNPDAIDSFIWFLDEDNSPDNADILDLLDNPFGENPVFTPIIDAVPTAGVYTLILQVESSGGQVSDLMTTSISVLFTDPGNLQESIVPPAAIAGPDQTVFLNGGDVDVKLVGHDSIDPDSGASGLDDPVTGDFLFSWTILDQPAASTFFFDGQETEVDPEVTLDAPGDYLFGLNVTDNNDDKLTSKQSTVTMHVLDKSNWRPQALIDVDPPGDVLVNQIITLTGINSSDPEEGALNFGWTQTGGQGLTITPNPESDTVTLTPLNAGTYSFDLTVTDPTGQTDTETVIVNVVDPGNSAPSALSVPSARARAGGQDVLLEITVPTGDEIAGGATPVDVTLSGNLSTGTDGQTTAGLSFQWIQLSGPTLSILNANSNTATITPYVSRTYYFLLTVTDDATGLNSSDIVYVSVSTSENDVPTANIAGNRDTYYTSDPSVSLDLSASSDPNGSELSYYVTQKTGPPISFTITNGNLTFSQNGPIDQQSTERHEFLKGNYTFCLVVDDGEDLSSPIEFEFNIEEGQAVLVGGGGGGSFDLLMMVLLALLIIGRRSSHVMLCSYAGDSRKF